MAGELPNNDKKQPNREKGLRKAAHLCYKWSIKQ